MTILTMLAAASHGTLAAQSVARGPLTAAQPSFNGHGWLVVYNLWVMTVAALLALMMLIHLVGKLVEPVDPLKPRGPLVALLRVIALVAFGGMFLRTGVEAVTLWGWDPFNPDTTGWYLTLKRVVDPFGGLAYIASMCLYKMTEDAMVSSLEREPFPKKLIAELPKLRRPACLTVLTLIAAIGVVSTR